MIKKIFFIIGFVLIFNGSFGQGRILNVIQNRNLVNYTIVKKKPESSKKVYPDNFNRLMKSVLVFEGGFSDVLGDPGGATNMGITQQTYDVYRVNKKLPVRSVRMVTKDEVYDCYYRYYYLPAGCDRLPEALSFVQFDTSVNFGVGGSLKLLKKVMDGVDLTKLDTLDKSLALKYIDVRVARRYEIVSYNKTKQKFLKGWLNRDMNLEYLIMEYY